MKDKNYETILYVLLILFCIGLGIAIGKALIDITWQQAELHYQCVADCVAYNQLNNASMCVC